MSVDGAVAEVRRRLSAPPEQVFAAFANPELVRRWLSPSPEIALTVLQLDFWVGGTYRFSYRTAEGQTMVVNGTYRTIEAPSRIAFSWNIEPPDVHAGLESEVNVEIEPDGSGTRLVIRHERLTHTGAADRHAQGWQGALDRLEFLLRDTEQKGAAK